MKVIKMGKTAPTQTLFGLNFFAGTSADFLQLMENHLAQTRLHPGDLPTVVFTPNPEQVMLAQKLPAFRQLLMQANFLLPDGIGIVQASRWFKFWGTLSGQSRLALPERIAGIDVVQKLVERDDRGPILVIGGRGYQFTKAAPGSSKLTNSVLPSTIPLKLKKREVTWFTGYQSMGTASHFAETVATTGADASTATADEQAIRHVLRKLKPAIVFVAFGAPDQEEWIINHLKILRQAQVNLVMAVGGSFDVLTGALKRAPGWWRRLGLEWLFRLVQEPYRWRRQLQLLSFVGLTWREGWKILHGSKQQ